MELAAAAAIGMGLAGGIGACGAAIGDGLVTAALLQGVARQPEARGQLMTLMFISVGLIESLPIIAIVMGFILMGKM